MLLIVFCLRVAGRQYCTRKLARVRHALKFTQGRKTFSKKSVTREKVVDVRFLEIVLVEAERVRVWCCSHFYLTI